MAALSLHVDKPGPLTTVQDHGRLGWEMYGIPRGGAIDMCSYSWANRLAANLPDCAALQATLTGPAVTVSADCWLATAGATVVRVNGRAYPPWSGFWAPAGATVSLEQLQGARAYLAVHGGIAVPPVLGSRSTDLESHFGGYEGRALRVGDELPIGEAGPVLYASTDCLQPPHAPTRQYPLQVRAVAGPRQDEFPAASLAALVETTFTVSNQSNHVGIRLDGAAIPAPPRGSRISEPMPVGGVQITPRGQPIILLNARGTIGGYPLLATVISVDVWKLGQIRPGEVLRFREVSVEEGWAAALEAREELAVPAVRRQLDFG